MGRVLAIVLITVLALVAVAAIVFHEKPPVPARHPFNNDPWKLVSYDPNNPYGTYLGNGFISTRIMGDGVGTACYMAGLYDNEKLIPTSNWADLGFYDGKKQFRIDKNADYRQVLDMKTGILTTYATWRAGDKTLKGKIEVVVSRAEARVGLVRAELSPDFNGRIRIEAPLIDGGLVPETPPAAQSVCAAYRTKQSGLHLVIATCLGWTKTRGTTVGKKAWHLYYQKEATNGESECGGQRRVTAVVGTDGPTLVESWTSLDAGPSLASLAKQAGRRVPITIEPGSADGLVRAHKAAWAKLWSKDIIIDGPVKDQQAIHSCMFYLLESVREGSQWSIPPMGLSNNEFGGHVFWDADTWMFPALILQHSELARVIVDYRYNTLPGAMANAKADGCKGAEYAWESGYTGKEDIAPGLPYRHERHINGDVALAQWQYYLATGDNEWLRTRGFPVLKATADYWVSRVTYNAAKKRYEILQVVPPDENADLINNSAYTNAIAKMNLAFAVRAAKIVNMPPNPKWSEIADKMYIPFDKKAQRFIAFDGYKGFKAKQADTELLAYPLQFKIPGQDMTHIYKSTFQFYQPKVMPNGPAMSSSAHAIIAARLGDCAGAYKFWQKSYTPYLRGPFNYFNEKQSRTWEQMCFLTGAAGPVQATLFGLAGIQIDYDNPGAGLVFKPCLPKQWKGLTITNIRWRYSTYSFVTVVSGNKLKTGVIWYDGPVRRVQLRPRTPSTQHPSPNTQSETSRTRGTRRKTR